MDNCNIFPISFFIHLKKKTIEIDFSVFVSNISFKCTEKDLMSHFSKYNPHSAKILLKGFLNHSFPSNYTQKI